MARQVNNNPNPNAPVPDRRGGGNVFAGQGVRI